MAAASSSCSVDTVLELPAADDLHLHIRDDPWLPCLAAAVSRQFRRGLIMPNLKPPITTTDEALAYHKKIESALSKAYAPNNPPPFTPLMTLYLTHSTTPEEIKRAASTGIIVAAKLYPCGATTHSQSGVFLDRVSELENVFQSMSDHGMLLLIHGEVTDPSIDIFDRERVFIEQFFIRDRIHEKFPKLKIVLEHISTTFAVNFIKELKNNNVAATITAHHLLYNRAALLVGGLNSHYYCLPILKAEADRVALLDAATSGNPRFFAGTDSAPHPKSSKLSTPAPAGCYTAFAAIELYAEAFDSIGRLSALEGFLCRFGAEFYGIKVYSKTDEDGKSNIRLIKKSWTVPKAYYLIAPESSSTEIKDNHVVVPIRSGGEIQWKLEVHPSREPTIKLSTDDTPTH